MVFRLTLGSHEAGLFPLNRFPVVSGSDLGSSLQARFPKKRLVFQTKEVYQSLHIQRIE